MKKVILSASMLVGITATAQTYDGRVGVNTTTPNATLDIREIKDTNLLPLTRMQGLSLPNFSTEERAKFTGDDYQAGTAESNTTIRPGTLIYNTTKKCIEMYVGYNAGTSTYDWTCLCTSCSSGGTDGGSTNPAAIEGTATLKGTARIAHANCPTIIYEDVPYNITVKKKYDVGTVDEANAQALAEANQQLEALKAREQERINQGTCPSDTLPTGASFQDSGYYIVSVKDADYMPFEKSRAPLKGEWTRADGVQLDPEIHFPGVITTTGEEVEVPINVTSAGGTLRAGSARYTVPEYKTEDGISRTLVLEWDNTRLTRTTKSVKMRLKSEGGDLNIMLLDLLKGLGQDGKGVNLAEFVLPIADGTTGNPAKFAVNVIPGIKDEAWDRAYYDGKYYHKSVYYPGAVDSKGKYVLSQELGAPITRLNTAKFDPWAKYTNGAGDQLGYLYAYGVGNNGHEVHDGDTLIFGTATDNLWKGTYDSDQSNNPCPAGFHPVSLLEAKELQVYPMGYKVYVNASDSPNNTLPFKNYSDKQIVQKTAYYVRTRDVRIVKVSHSDYQGDVEDSSSNNGADSGRLRCIRK